MTNLYRTIILLIALVFLALVVFVNYGFARQNERNALEYNLSALQGLTDYVSRQCDFFSSYVNETYRISFAYKEGLFSVLGETLEDSYKNREVIYRFLEEGFAGTPSMISFSLYFAPDDSLYTITKQKRRYFDGGLAEAADMRAVYENKRVSLVAQPSAMYGVLGTARSYSLIRSIRDRISFENIGAVQADFGVDVVDAFLETSYPGVYGDFYVVNGDGRILYASAGDYDGGAGVFPWGDELLSNQTLRDYPVRLGGERYFANLSTIPYPQLKVISLVKSDALFNAILQNILAMVAVTVALIGLASVAIFAYLKGSSLQLERIYSAMRDVQEGRLNGYIDVGGPRNNELYEISVSFNEMLRNLNAHIDSEYKAKIDATNYRFDMLRSQINPHFLYNTLESIRMKAVIEGARGAGEMIQILSKIFRRSVKADGVVTIAEEMEMCKDYLRLCELQYSDLFAYDIDVSPQVLGEKIVSYTMLVCVENFIMHGLDKTRGDNRIKIEAGRHGGDIRVVVGDNGLGMDAAALEGLRGLIAAPSAQGGERVGLRNIYQRTLIVFGERSGLRIDSRLGAGTTVAIEYPVQAQALRD